MKVFSDDKIYFVSHPLSGSPKMSGVSVDALSSCKVHLQRIHRMLLSIDKLSCVRLSCVRLSCVRLSCVRLSCVRLSCVRFICLKLNGFFAQRPLNALLSTQPMTILV